MIQFWAYSVDFSHKRPPLVSDHFLVHRGWSLTRELTVINKLRRECLTNIVAHQSLPVAELEWAVSRSLSGIRFFRQFGLLVFLVMVVLVFRHSRWHMQEFRYQKLKLQLHHHSHPRFVILLITTLRNTVIQ